MRRPLIAAAVVALALPLLAACGSDASNSSSSAASSAPSASPSALACIDSPAIPKAEAKPGETPSIAKPTGAAPCELVVKDLTVGKGAAVKDIATPYLWNYEGVSWSTGQKFDSSFDRGEPTPFALNQVIPGWTEGLQGMKPGGRRMLIIPSDQAYGPTGQGQIGPNETLVFVVDLVGPATPATTAP